MKKLLFLCALFVLITQSTFANPETEFRSGTVSGQVLDKALNEPLPYVNVVIKNDKNETVTGGITLDDGRFNITKISEGIYTLSVQYIGYKTVNKPLDISRKNSKIELGIIYLEEATAELDAVTVIAEISTIQQKVDRKVITVGKDLTTAGPTASEIMNNLPSVSVDQQTGALSMRGNQNVRVMVDGKLSNIPAAQLLKQIPSTSIKSIELITNPSAKYNPEGMSGIINIILHKNINIGFNGNFNVSLGYQEEPKFNSSVDMNYRNGKLNFFGSYGNNISKNVNYGNINRPEQEVNQLIDVLSDNNSHLFKVGVDYYINDKNTLSVFTNQNLYDGAVDASTDILYSDNSFNQFQEIGNKNDNLSQQYNFNYKIDFDKEGHNLEFEADYNDFDADSNNLNSFIGYMPRPNYFERTDTDRKRTTINLDYTNPLTEDTKFEFGLQARLFDNTISYLSDARSQNNLGEYIPTSTDFDYKRDIYSAYATFSKKFEKWSYQVGLRAETVNVETLALEEDLESGNQTFLPFDNDYVEFYPSAFFTYSPSEKNSYQLSYSRRIDRPGVGQVNPLPEWNTPLVSQYGNQELLPQFTNSIEANYTRQLEKGSITAGLFYRLIEDEITQAVFIDRSDLNRVILSFDNFDNTSAYGIEFSSNYRPTKWWSINGSFDLYSQTQTSLSERLTVPVDSATIDDIVLENVEVDNIAWNFRMFNNFKVSKKLSLSAFGFYRGKNKGVQFEMEPMYFVNLGMRYNFLDNKATFSFNFNDVFDTMRAEFKGNRPFLQEGQFNWESRTLQASLSYRFGDGKYKAKSRKQRDNDELQGGGIL